MASEFAPTVLTQLWQVTLLILVVAAVGRWLSPRHPHLSHLLWLVVLVKCVTPPLWASSGGVFCWLQPERQIESSISKEMEWTPIPLSEFLKVDLSTTGNSEAESSQFAGVYIDEAAGQELLITDDRTVRVSEEWSGGWVSNSVVVFWLFVCTLVLLVVTLRWLRFWKLVSSAERRDSTQLEEMLQAISQQLRIRRRVRLIVTESLVGPAVVGFFRVTILIPAVVVDKLKGQSIEPILAHELLHIRRGDLWIGLLQTVAQALWWFHPMVWWVGRETSREAERCCDEEVLGELKCDPASYARALLDVLDLKSQLKPVPVFPGVRPVDVTSQRLERIMTLRQGCRRRSPWWCWLVALGAAVLTLPGAAFVVTAQDEESSEPTTNENFNALPAPPVDVGQGPFPPMPLPQDEELRAYAFGVSDKSPTTEVYDISEFAPLLSGSEFERHQKFEQLVRSRDAARKAQVNWFNNQPVVKTTPVGHSAIRQCLDFFVESGASSEVIDSFLKSVSRQLEATLVCEMQVISVSDDAYSKLEDVAIDSSDEAPWVIPAGKWEEAVRSVNRDETFHYLAPQCAVFNGRSVMVESVTEHPVSLKREDDGRLVPGRNWSGWKTQLLPFIRSDGSFWLGVSFENGRTVGTKTLPAEQAKQLKAEGKATIHEYQQVSFSATLKEGQVVVLPGFEVTHGNDTPRATLMTAQVRRLSNKPSPNAVPSPRRGTGTALKSDAGIEGEVLLDTVPKPATLRSVPTIQQTSGQNFGGNDEAGKSEGQLLTRRALGSQFLTIRRRGNGTVKPRMTIVLSSAEGNDVLIGTADDVEINETKQTQSVELADAKLQAAGGSEQRFLADRLRLINDNNATDKPALRMELESAEVQFESGGQKSQLKAERIDLEFSIEPFVVEKVQANGLGSLRTDSPVKPPEPGAVAHDHDDRQRQIQNPAQSAKEQAQKILGQKVSVSFPGTPLDAVLKSLSETHGLNIVLDTRGLEEEDLRSDEAVLIEVSGVTLRSILELILGPLNLATKINEDGVLIVTSRERALGGLITMVYPVADLVIPIPERVRVESPGTVKRVNDDATNSLNATPAEAQPSQWRLSTPLPGTSHSTDFDFEKLTELIEQTVHPESWQEVGGSGAIRTNETTLSLVIRQTRDTHQEVSDLLDQLRRLRDVQVTMQVQMLNVPESFLTDRNLQLKFKPLAESKSHHYTRLSSAQADEFRNAGRPSEFPKVALFNGQLCEWRLTQQDGMPQSWFVQPFVSGDRQSVRLGVGIDIGQSKFSGEAVPTSVAVVSDGEAILVEVNGSTDKEAPIVAEPIPGRPRAFRRVSQPRRFVLIQPKVVLVEEEEVLTGTEAKN